MRGVALGLALLLGGACGSSSEGTAPAAGSASAVALSTPPSASATVALASAAAPASVSGEAPSGTEAPALEGAPQAGTYAGTYKAKVGAVNEVPKEAKSKVWSSDPGTEALGDGTLSVTVTSGKRVVAGEAHGPLGDQIVGGELEGKTLRARVDPSDPNLATAMTGILTGTFEGSGFKGVLRVAGRDGRLVREGAVTLTRK